MRLLLIGCLSATLIGCCPQRPHATLEGCTSADCLARTASSSQTERKQASLKPSIAATKMNAKKAVTTAKQSSDAANNTRPAPAQPSNMSSERNTDSPSAASPPPQPATTNAAATRMDAVAHAQPQEVLDPVLKKAQSTVAAKMEDPVSTKFVDMKRAIRKDTFGQPIDTVCGHVKGKKSSGQETNDRPFLYVVTQDIAFVDFGVPNSAAAGAYRNICTDMN